MSNRKRTKSNNQSIIFEITLKKKNTEQYAIIVLRSDFRLKRRKRVFGTEVSRRPWRKTSVQSAENGSSGRKSEEAQCIKLPSQMPKMGLRDGSQQEHME